MFTGIIEMIGSVQAVRKTDREATLTIDVDVHGLTLGESIGVDGACLTVARVVPGGFVADASTETLTRTTLGNLTAGSKVHLE